MTQPAPSAHYIVDGDRVKVLLRPENPITRALVFQEAPVTTKPNDYTHADEDGDVLRIEADYGYAFVAFEAAHGVNVSKSDAPAVALALLERAGWTEDAPASYDVRRALGHLRLYVSSREVEAAKTAEAKAAEEALDREALALYRAAHGYAVQVGEPAWSGLVDEATRDRWRKAAAKAREMHK